MPEFDFSSLIVNTAPKKKSTKKKAKKKPVEKEENLNIQKYGPNDNPDIVEAEKLLDEMYGPTESIDKNNTESATIKKTTIKKKTTKKKTSKKKSTKKTIEKTENVPAATNSNAIAIHLEDLYITSDELWDKFKYQISGQFKNWLTQNKSSSIILKRPGVLEQISNAVNMILLEKMREIKWKGK